MWPKSKSEACGAGAARSVWLGAFLIVAALPACRLDMYDQPRYEALEPSDIFADGRSSRDPIAGTVARGALEADPVFLTGMVNDSTFTDEMPFELTQEILERGRERYNIFCSVCHDAAGAGRGMIVRRGYKQPPSFHIERLRAERVGYFYDVIKNGFATMPGYAAQIPPDDRWAIVAYIRALQLSQYARLDELPADVRREIERAAGAAQADEKHGEAHD
ncbi:MAG: cytochrome c [Candidatus Latescibacterota bacterium]|nr:MAG: cytochrome c [Candidatus Latescibacterota bacterium]